MNVTLSYLDKFLLSDDYIRVEEATPRLSVQLMLEWVYFKIWVMKLGKM